MGELCPPILAASAIARIRHGAKEDFGGSVRKIGRIRVKQRVGAATLLIHILAKQLTPIKAKRTLAGFVPAVLRTLVIISLSMLVLLKAEEIVNPPIKSMIVGEKMTEKTNFVASWVDSLCPSVRITRRTTRRKGTAREVTNKGLASDAQKIVQNTKIAKQSFAAVSPPSTWITFQFNNPNKLAKAKKIQILLLVTLNALFAPSFFLLPAIHAGRGI
jgi:hypothetical protein